MTPSRKPLSESQGTDSGEPTDLQSVARTNLAETQDSNHPSRFPKIDGYNVTAVLGRGGMGVVYRARQLGVGRIVALKLVRGDLIQWSLALGISFESVGHELAALADRYFSTKSLWQR